MPSGQYERISRPPFPQHFADLISFCQLEAFSWSCSSLNMRVKKSLVKWNHRQLHNPMNYQSIVQANYPKNVLKSFLTNCFLCLFAFRSTDYGTTYSKLNLMPGTTIVVTSFYICPTNKKKVGGCRGYDCVVRELTEMHCWLEATGLEEREKLCLCFVKKGELEERMTIFGKTLWFEKVTHWNLRQTNASC